MHLLGSSTKSPPTTPSILPTFSKPVCKSDCPTAPSLTTSSSSSLFGSISRSMNNDDISSHDKSITTTTAVDSSASIDTSKYSSQYSSSTMPTKSLLLPSIPSISNIQLPTKPLDRSEVNEFSASSALSSQPPPDVASALGHIGKQKAPSTVSLLRGMRLKKSLQGRRSETKAFKEASFRDDEPWNDKKPFVRPFEDDYITSSDKTNTTKEAFSEIQDTSYTPPEYRITEKAILGDINVSIPVTLESNLKHINGSHVNNSGDFEDGNHILINKKYKKEDQGQVPSSEFSSNNNNNIICSKQVTYK